jgi:hypothetical protein
MLVAGEASVYNHCHCVDFVVLYILFLWLFCLLSFLSAIFPWYWRVTSSNFLFITGHVLGWQKLTVIGRILKKESMDGMNERLKRCHKQK